MPLNLASRERLQPSLLDRLTDLNPEQTRDPPDQQALTMAALRQAVLRDLAWLLNATNLDTTEDLTQTPHAASSTLNYGIPGFAGLFELTRRTQALEAAIATAIKTFEPRIAPQTVRVRARAPSDTDGPTALVFDIEGELWAQPVPQQLFLQTAIELETRLAVVKDARPRG
jgi:type VI secretion system protein ImpF